MNLTLFALFHEIHFSNVPKSNSIFVIKTITKQKLKTEMNVFHLAH